MHIILVTWTHPICSEINKVACVITLDAKKGITLIYLDLGLNFLGGGNAHQKFNFT
jgi:hypothetical protein